MNERNLGIIRNSGLSPPKWSVEAYGLGFGNFVKLGYIWHYFEFMNFGTLYLEKCTKSDWERVNSKDGDM